MHAMLGREDLAHGAVHAEPHDGQLAILYRDGRLEVGGAVRDRRVREISHSGVIFEDGTASIWWSNEGLLRPLGGIPDSVVELVEGCALTNAKKVYCWQPSHGEPSMEPLSAMPAIFVERNTPR